MEVIVKEGETNERDRVQYTSSSLDEIEKTRMG